MRQHLPRIESRGLALRELRRQDSAIFRWLILAAVVLFLCQNIAASPGSKVASAAAAYRRAERLRVTLRSRRSHTLAAYLRVVQAYQLVYRKDPEYRKAPDALAAAAATYANAGREFASDRYYTKAVQTYRFVMAQYPRSALSSRALFTIAQIYRKDIENPEAAREAYREYLKKYPHSARAADAGLEIARIDEKLSAWEARQAIRDQQPAAAQSSAGHEDPGGPAEVEGIQHWVGPNYTRIVIRTGRQVKFSATHLENPPRLIFDLANTRLSPDLERRVFAVGDGFLQRVRVAQFRPKTTRVVLDVPQIEDYSVFSLPRPFRLVIDIHGKDSGRAAVRPGVPRGALFARGSRAGKPDVRPAGRSIDSVAMPGPDRRLSEDMSATGDASQESAAVDPSVVLSAPKESSLTGFAPTLTRTLGLKIRRIVIDPGHGGHDTGTIGPAGIEEKNVVLDVALRLRRLVLRKLGCRVSMTRSTDRFIPLEERTAIANESGADLFISIHANASRDSSARGIETYYLNFTADPEALAVAARENATSERSVFQLQSLVRKIALSEKIDESRDFAKVVDRQLKLHLDEDGDRQPDRGIKKAPFVVLIGANMPSILVEISFLSNPHDARLLRSPRFRQEIARALYGGIARYAESLGTIRVAQRAPAQSVQPLQHLRASF